MSERKEESWSERERKKEERERESYCGREKQRETGKGRKEVWVIEGGIDIHRKITHICIHICTYL